MWTYAIKILISSAILVAISEIAKRSSLLAAVLASLPMTSLLAFVWLYLDTGDVGKVSELSRGIFWLVIPSLLFFIVFPMLTKNGLGFWTSLGASCLVTAAGYFGMLKIIGLFGLRI